MVKKLHPTQIIWWRFGKEHAERDDFRVNMPEVIAQRLDQKVATLRKTPEQQWRWWQVDETLLIERPQPSIHYSPDTRIYYLVEQGLAVIENIHLPAPRDAFTWYIHLADIFYDAARACWIKKDLFVDIILEPDTFHYRVLDLDDLATALELGLTSPQQVSDILNRTNSVLESISTGHFPFPEIRRGQEICRQMK